LEVILLNCLIYKQPTVVFVGKTVLEFPSLDSTNEFCRELIRKREIEEGTVIWTRNQLKGRGQDKNRWESQQGKNLTFSILFHPLFLRASEQFYLSMAISLGITGFLRKYIDNVRIKWPNDIYVAGRKIAGILIESSVMENRLKYSIAGIGLNINQTRFSSGAPCAVSVKQITSRHLSLTESLREVCSEIEYCYLELKRGSLQEITDRYTGQLYWLNEMHQFKKGQDVFNACLRGVDNFGRLLLEDENGVTAGYGMKEVEFIH
jgi:BirA family transcriptional regulator, biotin operon repressor / biotin---[acetyl-CoA-carboxylase] ligase